MKVFNACWLMFWATLFLALAVGHWSLVFKQLTPFAAILITVIAVAGLLCGFVLFIRYGAG